MAKRKGDGIERGKPERKLKDLPAGIPWVALGLDPEHYYVIDGDGLFRVLPRDRAGHMLMLGVCGSTQSGQDWAFHNYGRKRKVKDENGNDTFEIIPRTLQPELLGQDISLTCGVKGSFDPAEAVRHQGAWLGEDYDLVLHCGSFLWARGARCETGLRGRHVYPSVKAIPLPYDSPVGCEIGRQVMDDIGRWHLDRFIDKQLLLGMLGLGMLAGAMQHRPNVLLIGEHGGGKTGLMELFKQYLGPRMLLTPDATPAGITQRVGHGNMLIGLDEKEAGVDPKRDSGLLALLRACYSGGESLRGGQDHTGHSFSLRCAVLAAAINPPAMDSADRSRNICITVLGPPNERDRSMWLAYDAQREVMGTQLLRRLADNWKRLQLETMPAWEGFLREVGFDGRGIDTVGTLLSLSWVLREDRAPTQEDADVIADQLHVLLREERAERHKSYDRFLNYVLGLSIDPMRKGEWRTVLEMIKQAAGYGSTLEAERRVESDACRYAASDDAAIDAQRQLSRIGLRIGSAEDDSGDRVLLVANHSSVLSEMLRGTTWCGSPTAGSPWSRLLLRAPGAVSRGGVRFAIGVQRAVELRLGWVLRGVVGPDPEAEVERWADFAREHAKDG